MLEFLLFGLFLDLWAEERKRKRKAAPPKNKDKILYLGKHNVTYRKR